jgi:plasmid replication initiation protein
MQAKQAVPIKHKPTENKNLVYLDNKLAQASYSLNLSEQRLLFLSLSKTRQGYSRSPTESEKTKHLLGAINLEDLDLYIPSEDFDSTTLFTISILEYAKTFDIRPVDAREELLAACNNLFNRYIVLKETNGSFKRFRWVQGIEYDAKEDFVGFRWSFDIVPYIKDIQNYFTKLKFGKLLFLQSTYSWKLFTFLCSRRGENKYVNLKASVEELMFVLDVPESCKEFKHFNNLILKKVVKEFISKLGMVDFKIEFEKQGRSIKHVVFKGFTVADGIEYEETRLANAQARGVSKDV